MRVRLINDSLWIACQELGSLTVEKRRWRIRTYGKAEVETNEHSAILIAVCCYKNMDVVKGMSIEISIPMTLLYHRYFTLRGT